MAFFTVALHVLIFALCAGVVLAVIIFVPLAIYIIPYGLWVGYENGAGRQLDKKKQSPFQAAKNATKLYSAWICRRKPNL